MEATAPLANEREAFALGAAVAAKKGIRTNKLPMLDILGSSLTRVKLGRFDPLSTLSVMLGVNDFFQKDHHACVQCVARYVDRDGSTLVTRIVTHRLPVANNVGEFLDAVDEDVIPVLLAKEAVYRSMFGRETDDRAEVDAPNTLEQEKLAYDSQRDLDATINKISGAYRLVGLEQGTRG